MLFFGNFNLKVRYCGFIQTFGLQFLSVLVDCIRQKEIRPSYLLNKIHHGDCVDLVPLRSDKGYVDLQGRGPHSCCDAHHPPEEEE